ncbi:MAG: ATP-binding protein [Solirubrobacterales bacterium]|nr:ATP-binding protein [Solirubrobacterales bacterium]
MAPGPPEAPNGLPACPLGRCDGSGWILAEDGLTASRCACLQPRLDRVRAAGINSVIPRRYRGVSFERPPVTEIDPNVVDPVREWIEDLDGNLERGRGLWLMGDTGTGKTTLAMLISKELLRQGHTVAIYSLPKLLARIRSTYGADQGEESYADFFERLCEVDMLHLEDLGTEYRTEWVLEQLYALVNERYERQRSIMVTTNSTLEQLEEQLGDRVVSRLVEICGDPLALYGDDRRITFRPPEG